MRRLGISGVQLKKQAAAGGDAVTINLLRAFSAHPSSEPVGTMPTTAGKRASGAFRFIASHATKVSNLAFEELCHKRIPQFLVNLRAVGEAMYRYEAASADGFVDQLIRYIGTGHYFYVTGRIPDKKAPESVDRKLLDRYEIEMPRWQRSRKKQAGTASVHYLRFERFFILIATHGRHRFFDEHDPSQVQDCRRVGIKFEGYSIRYRYSDHTKKWHTLVRLDADTYKGLKAHLTELATKRSKVDLEDSLRSVWFQPYRPVREQLLNILRAMNCKRKTAGLEPLDWQRSIRQKRRKKPVFREAA